MRRRRLQSQWIVLTGVLALVAGCASGPGAGLDGDGIGPGRVYTLDVQVRGDNGRAARFVVLPDGSARALLGDGVDARSNPPVVRRLTPAQRTELWGLVEASGVLDPASGWAIDWGELWLETAWDGEPVAVVSVREGSRRVQAAAPMDGGAPGVSALVDWLSAMVWAGAGGG